MGGGEGKARRLEATEIIHTRDKNTFNYIEMQVEMEEACGSRCTWK